MAMFSGSQEMPFHTDRSTRGLLEQRGHEVRLRDVAGINENVAGAEAQQQAQPCS